MADSPAERRLLRAAHPVVFDVLDRLLAGRDARRVPGLGVVVRDPGLVREVLRDNRFRKDGPGSSGALWAGVLGHRTLIGMEGPPHRTLRGALTGLFTPDAADRVCAQVLAEPLGRVTQQLSSGQAVDLVPVAREVATTVIAHLVGLLDGTDGVNGTDDTDGSDDRSRLAVVRRLLAAGDEVLSVVGAGTRRLSGPQVARVTALLRPLTDAAGRAYDAADPATVLGRLPALGVSRAQARGLAAVLLLTGTETVVSAAPRGVALLHDTGLLSAAADTGATRDLVTEVLRMTTPSPAMLRRATTATTLGGVRVRRGDRVVLGTWWATRTADGFDPARPCPPAVRNLWFGAGPHVCLGGALATAEVAAVLDSVLAAQRATGRLRVVRRRPRRRVLVPSYAELVVQVAA